MAFPQSPDPGHITALVAIIASGVSGGAQGASGGGAAPGHQTLVIQQLDAFFAAHGDYPWYLGWILCVGCGTGEAVGVDAALGLSVRMSAGLLLKNELRRRFSRGESVTAAIDTRWLPSLAELILGVGLSLEEKALRHTASTVVSSLVAGGAGGGCPVTRHIVETLTNSYLAARELGDVGLEGAMDALVKVWEDCPLTVLEGEREEERDASGGASGSSGAVRWIGIWHQVLRLLEGAAGAQQVASREDEHARRRVETLVLLIQVLNYALYNQSGFLDGVGVLERYIAALFALATHPDPSVRRVVCVGLNHITELAPSKIRASNNLPNLIEYMIAATEDTENEHVALEASEFWTVFAEAGFDGNTLRPFVPRIVPLLLRNMRFEEWDESVEEAEAVEEEAGRPDEANAVLRPHVGGARKGQNVREGSGNADGEAEDNNVDDDDDTTWNLRKSAAAGLDMISTFLGDDILPILLPAVQACLNNVDDWRSREAAILALGAVSHGCHSGLAQHLDAILAAALPGLVDPRPMLRVISCWTLTRYSRQIIMRAKEGDGRGLDAVLGGIVDRVLQDRNWLVQVSACGSLSTLVEEEPGFVMMAETGNPDKICGALARGLQTYGQRGLRALYDAVGVVLLSCGGRHLSGSLQYNQMMEAIFGKLVTFADGDPEILPYLDCLSNVGASYSPGPPAGPVPQGDRSQMEQMAHIRLMEAAFFNLDTTMERYFVAMDSGALDPDEAIRFIEHILDAIDGLVLGLAAATAANAANAANAATGAGIQGVGGVFAKTALGAHITRAAQSNSAHLRQSAFGLLGDLMETSSPHDWNASLPSVTALLLPYLSPLVEAALATLHPDHITPDAIDACINAAWSLGVVSKACAGPDVAQFALVALERLAPILTAPMATLPRGLVQNAAVCLGRLALTTPETVAPHAHVYMGGWCAALRGLTDGDEKADAFKGLLRVVLANQAIVQTHFKSLCECFASWQRDGPDREGWDAWGLGPEMQQVVTLGVQSGFDLNVLPPSVRGKLGI